MSEYINNATKRIESLYQFSKGIINGENGTELIKKHQEAIDHLLPDDMINVFDRLVLDNIPLDKIKTGVNKILNLFYTSIKDYKRHLIPEKDTFLFYLKMENDELDKRLTEIKPIIKKINKEISEEEFKNEIKQLRKQVSELLKFDLHYIKKENILFPILEEKWKDYRCLQIMWAFHDDIRKNIKETISQLSKEKIDMKKINRLIADIFFNMYAIRFREEKILFTRILREISKDILDEMHRQSFEIGFSFIKTPDKKTIVKSKSETDNTLKEFLTSDELKNTKLDLGTGQIDLEQIEILLNTLPVDITFVDENDKVRFFSNPKERFFARLKAIIGRSVQNCHPPNSIHIVNNIINEFKSGNKNVAKFWIQIKDKFILIQYFAMRNKNGNYKGTLEVSQDITEIRNLKGERRLLDWG